VNQEWGKAAQIWNDYMSFNGEEGFALNNQANCLLAIGKLDEALGAISKAKRASPGSFEVFVNSAIIHQGMGKYHEAISDFSRALSIKKDPLVFISRGNAKSQINDTAGQIQDYKNAYKLAPFVFHKRESYKTWPSQLMPSFLPRKKSSFLDKSGKVKFFVQLAPYFEQGLFKEGITKLNVFFQQAV